jgi:hypothetical protein
LEEEEEEEELSPVKRGNKGKVAGKKKKVDPSDGAESKKSNRPMSESFKPLNPPCYSKLSLAEIRKTKEFLDPCGMEATDDIIDSLVGQQVEKMERLLTTAIANGDIGGQGSLLKLGTACSGTDAPALALQIVQEQLEKRGVSDFHFLHEFSCENEPFKQAYLARNFDSLLYPDITKLTTEDGSAPRDVFGREQPLPLVNLFVAGTSCKNFSAQRGRKRMDIEEHGCSGETFLAAGKFTCYRVFIHLEPTCFLLCMTCQLSTFFRKSLPWPFLRM